jgi:hypothetical protein
MLLMIEVENFQSIRERQVIDLRVPARTPADPRRFLSVGAESRHRVPKVAAFFGPNASGKTTILRAMAFAFSFMTESFNNTEPGAGILVQPFAADPWDERPTEIVLEYAPGNFLNEAEPVYRYELKIGRDSGTSYVAWEALRRSFGGPKYRTLFERTGSANSSQVKPYEDLSISRGDPRLSVRNNASVVSTLMQFDHEVAKQIYIDFKIVLSNANVGRLDRFRDGVTKHYDTKFGKLINLESLNQFIHRIDLGLDRVYLEERDGHPIPMFVHRGLDAHQPFESESQGTRNFYCMFPMLNVSLQGGGTAIIDEIDSDIHPMIMPELVRWFQSDRTNPHKSQLIMSCHAATLLEGLVKEEVWFAEKGETGASHFYGAKDITDVQRRTNMYQKYLSGAFGALPQVG